MFDNIKSLPDKIIENSQSLRDGRLIGLGLLVIIVALISWSSIKVIETNWRLQQQIAETGQNNQLQKLTNENLKLQNQYFESDQYLDVAARSTFGLAAEGETVLIVPEATAMSYTTSMPEDEPGKESDHAKQPAYQRNFQAWVDFFLHRERTN